MKKNDVRNSKERLTTSLDEFSVALNRFEKSFENEAGILLCQDKTREFLDNLRNEVNGYVAIDGDDVFVKRMTGEVKSCEAQLSLLDERFAKARMKGDLHMSRPRVAARPPALRDLEGQSDQAGQTNASATDDANLLNPIKGLLNSLMEQGQSSITSIRLQEMRLKGVRRMGVDMRDSLGTRISGFISSINKVQNREQVMLWGLTGLLTCLCIVYVALR